MCFSTSKPKKPTTPASPPPPPSEETVPTPDIGDSSKDELSLRRRREGRKSLVVGLNVPRRERSGLSLKGLT